MTRKYRKVFIYLLMLLNIIIVAIVVTKAVTAITTEKVIVTLTPDTANNKIKLDWKMNDIANKTFKIYQKKPGSTDFQTISTTDFESTEEEVKILNIYPENGGANVTFNYKSGGTQVLPKSASLKVWMEGGTMNENGAITTFDNYGRNPSTGKQIIKVTPVSITEFNNNPNIIWNYDVVMFGTWDSNGSQDINQAAVNALKPYIEAGYGILLGHDTMGYLHPFFNQISSYFNIDPTGNDGNRWYNGNHSTENGIGGGGEGDVSRVKIVKEGLFTQFPWKIGNIGTVLTAPVSHDLAQKAMGNIWLKYTHPNYTQAQMDDPYNYYLTTWNNTAMIQTGHSNCASTEDERKIIANILFYTKQRTTQTTTVDNSAQDLSAPNKVINLKYTFNGDSSIKASYTASPDIGSTYSYYVKATDRNGTEYNSDVTSATITTGMKGYSYIVDQTPGTIPSGTVNATGTEIQIKNIDWKKQNYLHIRAVDNVGNVSETAHIQIQDTIQPTIILSSNNTNWTKDKINISYTANDIQSGFEKIVTAKGEQINQKTGQYEVAENGTYTFTTYDKAGNTKQASIQISNIDIVKPTIVEVRQTLAENNKKVKLEIVANDYNTALAREESGIVGYYLTQNKEQLGTMQSSNSFQVAQNGIYYLYARDAVGNISEVAEVNVNTIEINIVGSVTWIDQENKYNARQNPVISLYRKIENEITEKVLEIELKDTLNYNFQQRECDNKGQKYSYWLEEKQLLGYETTYQNYDIKNELILPEYELTIATTPVETYQNKLLKNGKIKIQTQITAKENKEKVALTAGTIKVEIDPNIEINWEESHIYYQNGETGDITEILQKEYIVENNYITLNIKKGRNLLKQDVVTISIIGTAKEIANYTQTAELAGTLQDYREIPTNIALGIISKKKQQDEIEYQMPASYIELQKRDSITESSITDAIFTLYEWDGEGYQEKEKLKDENKDGTYEGTRQEWNFSSQGKYKIEETIIAPYHKDSLFSMEFVIEGLEKQDIIIYPNYQNEKQKIEYKAGEPDDLDKEIKVVENEPWKLKAQLTLVDSQTKAIIEKEASYSIQEWNKETGTYEPYISYLSSNPVRILRQEDKSYKTEEYLYYTEKNEGKYKIVEDTPPEGYSKEKEAFLIDVKEIVESKEYQGKIIENADTILLQNNNQTLEKTRIKANVVVQMQDKESGKQEAQVDASFFHASYAIYAKEDIYHADGKTGLLYSAGELVALQKTNEQGRLVFANLECGKYAVEQKEASTGYNLEETTQEVMLDYKEAKGEANFEIQIIRMPKVKKQGFKLNKVQEGKIGFEPVEGAGFSVYQISNLSIVKDKKIERVSNGKYKLLEEKALKDETITKKADAEGNYQIEDLIDYYYKIRYEEENREKLPTSGNAYLPYKIQEELVSRYLEGEPEEKIKELYSDVEGFIQSPRLAYGEYIVLETSVPKELVAVKPFVIKVEKEELEPQNLNYIVDDNFRANIKLYEIDQRTKKTIRNNTAKFVIRNTETKELVTSKKWKTLKEYEEVGTIENPFIIGEEGKLVTPMQLEVGNYQIEQIEAPEGYTLPEYEGYSTNGKTTWDKKAPIQVEISTNAVYYVDNAEEKNVIVAKQENKSQIGGVILQKEGNYLTKAEPNTVIEENKKQIDQYKFIYENKPVEDTVYQLEAKENIIEKDGSQSMIYAEGEIIGIYQTNAQGEAYIDNIPTGKYNIKEIQAGQGLVLKPEEIEIQVENTKNKQEAMQTPVLEQGKSFKGERQKVEISIKKEDKETQKPLSNALFGLYTNETIYDEKQEVLAKDILVSASRTSEEGTAIFSETIPLGEYYLKEIQAPLGYLSNTEKIEINASYTTDKIEVISISGQTQNKITQIGIRKVDLKGNYLENAKMQILDSNKNVIKEWYTQKEDQTYQGLLTNQIYYLQEIIPSEGYTSSKEITFKIKEDGQIEANEQDAVIEEAGNSILKMQSDKTKIKLHLQEENTENYVKGVTYQILEKIEQGESKVIQEITTKQEAEYLEKLKIGKYTIHQKQVPTKLGYVTMEDKEIEIKDLSGVQEIKMVQGITKTEIKLIDDYTNKTIDEKIQVLLKHRDGKKEQEWQNENGIKTLNKISIGTYILEIKGLSNTYETKEQIIEVKETNEKQTIEIAVTRRIFDMQLEKWIDSTIIIENGKQSKIDSGYHGEITTKEKLIVKVDILRRKLNNIIIKFEYSIRITNTGNIPGRIEEITDCLPKGFKFEQTENPDWTINAQNSTDKIEITTKKLEGKELQPKESIVLKVKLNWIGNENDLGEKINTAKITKAENKYNIEDIDSILKQENTDNTDTAKVIISIVTGEAPISSLHLTLILSILAITGLGIYWIKKYVLG